ncbi:sugar ABC transporter substrate-binding protein, partial [Mycobacterium kansasii]
MSNRKSLRIAAVCCALTVSLTSVAACNRDGGSSGGVKVGLITKTDTNPFFVKIREAAKKQADAKGASLVALAGK